MANAQRTCLGCGQVRAQEQLIRLALTAQGQVVVDRKRRGGGRGGYLCGPECLDRATKRKAWGRAFRSRVDVQSEVLRAQLAAVMDSSPTAR